MRQVKIVVKGQLDQRWSDWFSGFEITHTTDGHSTLTGTFQDQAELRGLLSRLADLGLELMSVNTRPGSPAPEPEKRSRGGGEKTTKSSELPPGRTRQNREGGG